MVEENTLAFRVEQVCLNALPALRQVIYDGWLLRFAGGHTRRANSVNPLYPGTAPLARKVAACEALYRAQGQPAIFRLPGILEPGLDPLLVSLGYRREDETCVRYMDLAGASPLGDPAVEITAAPSADWLQGQARLNRLNEQSQRLSARVQAAIAVPAGYAVLRVDGRPAALAYGALHDGIVCLNAVVTDPAQRRQGLSRRVVGALLVWAKQRGAEGACLQVLAENQPALALYGQIGFERELYRYHYRRQPAA